MPSEIVGDDEILYRRIQSGHYQPNQLTGVKAVSPQAFSDSSHKVSVDRANINLSNPNLTKHVETDGVLELVTSKVKGVSNIFKNDKDGKPLQLQTLQVLADPIKDDDELPDNPAHALIQASPDCDSRPVFKRVMTALALIATVKIPPTNP